MNVTSFLSKRLNTYSEKGYSSLITKVASSAVAISVAVMILAVSISNGYDKSIRQKIFGFWGHIQITDAGSNLGIDENPMDKDSIFTTPLSEEWVKSIHYYALKNGLVKTDDAISGIIVKGFENNMDWSGFQQFLVEGEFPNDKNEVIVSTTLQKNLNLTLGDKLRIHFIQEPMRARAPIISGFYNTNLVELDERIVFMDIENIRSLNGWSSNQVGGVEILVHQPELSSLYAKEIQNHYTDYKNWVQSIDKTNPEIFDWLNFLKTNQWIVLILMAIVAIVNMVSMLLVIILERAKMVGVLKALGAQYKLIRNLFLRKAGRIIFYGLIFGNIIGIGLALLQKHFKFIELDPKLYFLSHVPIELNWPMIILLNVSTIFIILLSLLVPTLIIKRIDPIKVLRFE